MPKKILIYTVPFGGHLTILKSLINQLKQQFDLQLVITGWSNIPPNLDTLSLRPIILTHGNLYETDPAIWTLPRMAELLPQCLAIAAEFNPDLILYDFFSPEGYIVGKKLQIPYWSSIPALVGPFIHQDYLARKLAIPCNQQALKNIQDSYSLPAETADMEMISDGFHFPGQKNIIWSYSTILPDDWMMNRQPHHYVFAGNIRSHQLPKNHSTLPTVYLSLGTVVMDNLWNQQPELRLKLQQCIAALAKLWKNKYHVIFSTQGKKVLSKYPASWSVQPYTNQIECLKKADVFVTHGGSNSFHEAVVQQVPMVIIPFFGDQPLVAKQAARLGIGINLGLDENIDTHKPKEFISAALAEQIDTAVSTILTHQSAYQHTYQNIPLIAPSVEEIFYAPK